MPIKIPNELPAHQILSKENIFIMQQSRADTQDIRPLRILILNLMPKKIETETQLLRLLGNTPLQVEVELMQTASYTGKNTPQEHLLKFYKTFDEVRCQRFDGMIITGAPIEHMPFEEVAYWPELCEIFDWAKENVFSSYFICWGAQAALYHYYGIKKHPMEKKLFGVFRHTLRDPSHYLFNGFDDVFYAPHSRYTQVLEEELERCPQLQVLSTSHEAGVYVAASRDARQFFVMGHSEYDRDTLLEEYRRDRGAGLGTDAPSNYFPDNDDHNRPLFRWKAHAHLLYGNWLNYFVYQQTPFDFVANGNIDNFSHKAV